jgi:hypothetical protein
MKAQAAKSTGLIDKLSASFEAALRTGEGISQPVALVWTDSDGEWKELFPVIQAVMPHVYRLGVYDPANNTGPAIWLKCIVDRTLPEAPVAGITPIVYLPGVSRQELRAAEDCRPALQPLIELQYRGRVWHQQNGRDWTVEAFLGSEDGLGLEIAQDSRTREAMLRALPLLAEVDLAALGGRRLDADDFDKLAVNDPVRDVLRWMGNPDAFRKGIDQARWQSFCNVCKSEFSFNPDQDGTPVAAGAILSGDASWDRIWKRYCESPKLYPGIPDLLREPVAGQGNLGFDQSRNPAANDEAEARLRRQFADVVTLPHHQACEAILGLEKEHGERREWVWASLGLSPCADSLAHLAQLAKCAQTPVAGADIQSIAAAYVQEGWRCDRAALDALANGKGAADKTLIAKIVQALYRPWLDLSARHFQAVVGNSGEALRGAIQGVVCEKDSCILFVDGLRFDVAMMLKGKLEARSFITNMSHRLAPIPTVTATAKPLATPVSKCLEGVPSTEDFAPVLSKSKQPATAQRLRTAMQDAGVELLEADEIRIPIAADQGGWTEMGRIDYLGHKLGVGMCSQIDEEVEAVADRVVALLQTGWSRVRIVTDHGWLLLPGGLPKFDLPPWVVQAKWARCAAVKGNSTPTVPTYGWHYNGNVQIASPPGIACFGAGNDYAHGGVSVQECVIPELIVERGAEAISAMITDVQWRGMRCRVKVKTNDPSLLVDLRTNYKNSETSVVATVKEVGPTGEVSLAVAKDMYEGASAAVVIVDGKNKVLHSVHTRVGGDE